MFARGEGCRSERKSRWRHGVTSSVKSDGCMGRVKALGRQERRNHGHLVGIDDLKGADVIPRFPGTSCLPNLPR
jgi:hypothetical protein